MILSFIRRPGFRAGLVAALLATSLMIILSGRWGTPDVPQLISDRMTTLIPLEIFSRILGSLESAAKPLFFAGVVVAQLVAGAVLGGYLDGVVRRGRSLTLVFLALVAGTLLFLGLVAAPVGGIGLFGSRSTTDVTSTATAFFFVALIFGATVVIWLWSSITDYDSVFDPGRRQAIRVVGLGIPAAVAAIHVGTFFNELVQRSKPPRFAEAEGELPPVITPTEDFYVVSKNMVDPRVSVDNWQLEVGGLVDNPFTLSYDELFEWDAVEQITTLECVSNQVGGPYISNARWTGIPLRDVLNEAGVRSGVIKVVLHAEDDYSDSITIEKSRDPRVILAYQINDDILPDEHGYPLRLIVPGIYGMKHVKWINKIELVDVDYKGYWQERGWSDPAPVLTMSRIDTPFFHSQIPIGQRTLIGGVAFSGIRGISRVMVSTDAGESWDEAEVEDASSEMSWVRWRYWWTPLEEMNTQLVARAWEGDGTPQIEERQPALPDGSTGLHTSRASVVEPPPPEEDEDEEARRRRYYA
jgi:DMSO/TMAO reductase YedYZ molybdopterin-dependent catalytic subunit